MKDKYFTFVLILTPAHPFSLYFMALWTGKPELPTMSHLAPPLSRALTDSMRPKRHATWSGVSPLLFSSFTPEHNREQRTWMRKGWRDGRQHGGGTGRRGNHVTGLFRGRDWLTAFWIFRWNCHPARDDGLYLLIVRWSCGEASLLLSLTWMMAGESCLAARCMGVSPLRSLMSVRAWLSSNSSFTHAESPRSHARWRGVWPDTSRELIWLEAERWRHNNTGHFTFFSQLNIIGYTVGWFYYY